MKRGFTLMELMVVVTMILIIASAMTTSVSAALERSKISRAQSETREMTNAILAFANYAEDGDLRSKTRQDQEASSSSLDFILGKVTEKGVQVPVLFNAAVTPNGRILDPWGHPYRVTIKQGERIRPPGVPTLNVRLFYPNWHRLREGER